MERTDLGRSSNSEPGGRCPSEHAVMAQMGIVAASIATDLPEAVEGKEAVAGHD